MPAKKFTVTHADGTRSTRSSVRADYAFAVVVAETAEYRVARAEEEATRYESEAARYAAALADGTITRRAKRWSYEGEDYIDVLVGGVWADAYITPRDEPTTDEQARARVERHLASAVSTAAHYRAQADAARGTATTYGVLRWSRTADLAAKGARGFDHLLGHGNTLTVVPVD